MKVLVIGSGGREHALCWKISKSPKVKKIFCAPGNAGTSGVAENVALKAEDIEGLLKFASGNSVDLTVVGPEAPLAAGIVDAFKMKGLQIFGPDRKAAQLESSKVFAKNLMRKYSIPTADYGAFGDYDEAVKYLWKFASDKKLVVKADGLAAGKGVLICNGTKEAGSALTCVMREKVFGAAGKEAIIEEYLEGEEASVQVFVDGEHYAMMVAAQDHKRVFDRDEGPNTGGMGAYAPAPVFSEEVRKKTEARILKPLISGLKKEGIEYKGVLYVGLMISGTDPYVLEYNCRFGDPETQVVLPLLKTDLIEIAEKINQKQLDKLKIEWYNNSAVSVVMASKGYPGSYEKGKIITGLSEAQKLENITVFHAGTAAVGPDTVTAGGRVLSVTGTGYGLKDAMEAAYKAVPMIKFDGAHFRKDIGGKAFKK